MASHRIGARLSGLSPEQLVAFIDEQAPLWSAAAMRVAEEHVARLVEQPEWILSEVLLSPDLAPHILAAFRGAQLARAVRPVYTPPTRAQRIGGDFAETDGDAGGEEGAARIILRTTRPHAPPLWVSGGPNFTPA